MIDFIPVDGSIVVVDDQIAEAMCLIKLLSQKGIPNTYYTGIDVEDLPEPPSQKVRLAFFDIQLTPGRSSHDYAQMILGLLEKIIPEKNGPYVIVLWSNRIDTHADEVQRQLKSSANTRPPLCVIKLSKGDFFVKAHDEEGLQAKIDEVTEVLSSSFSPNDLERIVTTIRATFQSEPMWQAKSAASLSDILQKLKDELSANAAGFELFTRWEAQVHKAAGQTVRSYTTLHTDSSHWAENLKYFIYRMAEAQEGIVKFDNARLMASALRTLNQTLLDDVENNVASLSAVVILAAADLEKLKFSATYNNIEYCIQLSTNRQKYQFFKSKSLIPTGSSGYKTILELKRKVKAHLGTAAPIDQNDQIAVDELFKIYSDLKHELNSKLHIDGKPISDLIPSNLFQKNVRFISRRKTLLENYFKFETDDNGDRKSTGLFELDETELRKILFVELEVTPPCDFAQKKWRKSRVLPGILIPENHHEKYPHHETDCIYSALPIVRIKNENYKAIFDFRLFKSVDFEKMKLLGKPLCRFRHELHADIISKLSNHINRLGIAALV
jgi:hypothetical protein